MMINQFNELADEHPEFEIDRERTAEGYKLLHEMTERLDKLERNFRKDVEGRILEAYDRIRMIPNVSSYQRSVALKRLADCYYNNERFHDALHYYTEALMLNDKLPVKRRVEELKIMTGEWM